MNKEIVDQVHVPIVEACVIVIADTLAWDKLKNQDVSFPDSAIFRLHSIS